MPELLGITVRQGRMNTEEMRGLMESGAFLAVVDATHPFATEVSKNIKGSARESGLPYFRLKRETKGAPLFPRWMEGSASSGFRTATHARRHCRKR